MSGNALQSIVAHAAQRSSFYRQRYSFAGADPMAVHSIDDLAILPIVTPQDLIDHGMAFRAKDMPIYRITSTGGTTFKPKTLFRTPEDTRISTDVMRLLFEMAGIEKGDTVMIGQPFDLSHIGYISLGGCEQLGACAIPIGLSMTNERLLSLMRQFRPTVIFTSPSRMITITRILTEVDALGEIPLRRILVAGERLLETQREDIRRYWGMEPADLYGSEETDGLAGSCEAGGGLHFMSDHFILELVVPGTDRCVAVRENVGEAVITSLYSRGTPLIRYRLGDILAVNEEPCPCGRSTPRIRILGRASDRLELFDGITLHGYQIESAVEATFGRNIEHQTVCSTVRPGGEQVEVRVDAPPSEEHRTTLVEALWECSMDLQASHSIGSLTFRVTMEPGCLEQTARGKTPRVIDRRHNR